MKVLEKMKYKAYSNLQCTTLLDLDLMFYFIKHIVYIIHNFLRVCVPECHLPGTRIFQEKYGKSSARSGRGCSRSQLSTGIVSFQMSSGTQTSTIFTFI